jgi:YD repeat-containing protein
LIKVTGPGLFVSSNLEENSTYDLTYDTNGNITKIIVTNDINEKYICTFEYKEVTIPQEMIETDINISIESLYLDLAVIIGLQ